MRDSPAHRRSRKRSKSTRSPDSEAEGQSWLTAFVVCFERARRFVPAFVMRAGRFSSGKCPAKRPEADLFTFESRGLRTELTGTENPRVGGSIPPLGILSSVFLRVRCFIDSFRSRFFCPASG